jgi:DNA-binding response OmpR family regulator
VARRLAAAIGAGNVITDEAELLVYETDGLSHGRKRPAFVVLPGSTADVVEVVRIAREAGVPLVPRGAGTVLSGGARPVDSCAVVSLTRMRRILEVDLANGWARVEPGVVNLDVTRAVAGAGLYYAPDPSSQGVCSVGGNVAENSGGAHCLKYGFTTNHVLAATVVLSDGSGLELTRQLKRDPNTREIPIIMVTARAAEDDRVTGLDGGADDYIAKPFSGRELLARIRAALRRTKAGDDEILRAGELTLDMASHQVNFATSEIPLGPTEYRLLEFFMRHPDRVYSRTQLLDRVWGGNVYVEERTVDVHIRRLRKALTPHACDRLIRTVRGSGYRFAAGTE